MAVVGVSHALVMAVTEGAHALGRCGEGSWLRCLVSRLGRAWRHGGGGGLASAAAGGAISVCVCVCVCVCV